MMRALWSAASGMKGQQTNMDVISHNIANVNTYGGKKVRAEFQDLVYQRLRDAGANSGADSRCCRLKVWISACDKRNECFAVFKCFVNITHGCPPLCSGRWLRNPCRLCRTT